jgi:23S rRNA (guanosine2251-2'-O)-methyltransferase
MKKNKVKLKTKNNTVTPPDDLIWGIHPILELLQNNPEQIREIQIKKKKFPGKKFSDIISLAKSNKVRYTISEFINLPLSDEPINHQGIIAKIDPYPTISFKELLRDSLSKTKLSQTLLVLDSILDPHNLGAIIRTAAAAGVYGIIIPKNRSASLNGTVAKAAAGTISYIKICRVTNLSSTIQELKKNNFWIYGTAMNAEKSIYETDFSGKTCLILGNEEKGVRPLLSKQCDLFVSVPIADGVDSLNVSVTAGVISYEILRQNL